jgi:hypothetical protein
VSQQTHAKQKKNKERNKKYEECQINWKKKGPNKGVSHQLSIPQDFLSGSFEDFENRFERSQLLWRLYIEGNKRRERGDGW